MPGTVDDFMRRFGGDGTTDDREAEHYYDRFASTHPNDREFDTDTMAQGTTEYLGQLRAAATSGRDGGAGTLPALVRQGHGQSHCHGGLGGDCLEDAPALTQAG